VTARQLSAWLASGQGRRAANRKGLFPLGLQAGAVFAAGPHGSAGREMFRFDPGAFGAGLVIVKDGLDARFLGMKSGRP